ncbi:hypothetical protein ES703_114708 [subsurface metagenome]
MSKKIETIDKNHKTKKKRRIFLYMIVFLVFDITQVFVVKAIRGEKKDTAGCQNSYYHHDLKPLKITEAIWGEHSYQIITNSLGFKDYKCRQVPLSVPCKRILFIGDSFTEGIGVEYKDTFVGHIEKYLKGKDIDVLNAAVRSYSPKLYYLKTKTLIETSDIQDEIVYEQSISSNSEYGFQKYFFYYTKKSLLRNIYRKIGLRKRKTMHSVFEDYFEERTLWPYDNGLYEKWGKRGLELAEYNMDLLLKLCEDNNIRMTISIYPYPLDLQKNTSSIYRRFWIQYARNRELELFDMFDVFQAAGTAKEVIQLFTAGDSHWNQKGHRVVAEAWLAYFYPE